MGEALGQPSFDALGRYRNDVGSERIVRGFGQQLRERLREPVGPLRTVDVQHSRDGSALAARWRGEQHALAETGDAGDVLTAVALRQHVPCLLERVAEAGVDLPGLDGAETAHAAGSGGT